MLCEKIKELLIALAVLDVLYIDEDTAFLLGQTTSVEKRDSTNEAPTN